MNAKFFKYYTGKVAVIIMAALVCLSCNTKRELKQLLHLQTQEAQQIKKANHAQVCVSYDVEKEVKYQDNTTPAYLWADHETYLRVFSSDVPLQSDNEYAAQTALVTLPLYILHQQFLI